MAVGLRGRGVDKRGCSRTDGGAWETDGQDVECVTLEGSNRNELCDEFVKGLVEGANSVME